MTSRLIQASSVMLFLAVVLLADGSSAQSSAPAVYQSYLAHVAAANASLRLDEAGETKRWLTAAPADYRGWEWHYLSARSDNSLYSAKLGETLPIKLTWNPDGTELILPMPDGSIRFLDGSTLTETRRLTGHKGAVYGARGHVNGRLASCSRDGSIRLWDSKTGDSLWAAAGGGQGLADVDMSPDGKQIAYSSWHRTDSGVIGIVSRWDAISGQKIWGTEYGVKPIVVCRFSPDGTKLAVGTWDWRVVVWNLDTQGVPKEMDFDDVAAYSAIDDIAWTPDSRAIVSATRNGTPRVWSVETGELICELRGHSRPVSSVATSPDGARFYTAGDDGTIKIWNSEDGSRIATLFGHINEVRSICVRPRDGRIASLSLDGTIRIWDGNFGREFSEMSARNPYNYALPLSTDGSRLASAGPNGSISIWNADGSLTRNFAALEDLVNDAAFSPDARLIGVVNWDSTVRILEVETGQLVRELLGQGGGSSSCSFSADGQFFASGSTNKSLVVWDVNTGERVRRVEMASAPYRVEYSRDGQYLAAGDQTGQITIWNPTSFEEIATITAGNATIYNLDFSADGSLLASASGDGVARTWRLPSGELVNEYTGHAGAVYDVAWSPDQSRLVTGSADMTARVWDTKTGQLALILSDFTDPVFNLIFSPDGSRLYASSSGTQIQVFDTVPHRDLVARRDQNGNSPVEKPVE